MNRHRIFLLFAAFLFSVAGAFSQQFDPGLLSKISVKDSIKAKNQLNSSKPLTGHYYPLYIGQLRAKLSLSHRADLSRYEISWHARTANYKYPDSSNIHMVVLSRDTISMGFYEFNQSKTMYYKAHPLVLYNYSRDTVVLGYAIFLPICLEALSKNNEWRKIEDEFRPDCARGLGKFILPPGQILVTAIPIYSGTFTTKARVRFNQCKPPEFFIAVNPEQIR
jgi:hypothetical protein